MPLRVAGLWRYPVKTLAGESIQTARLETTGIPGDRIVRVRGPEGVRTSRRHHRLIGLHGTLARIIHEESSRDVRDRTSGGQAQGRATQQY